MDSRDPLPAPSAEPATPHVPDGTLVVVGNSGTVQLGQHLCHSARELHVPVRFADAAGARRGPWLLTKFNWKLRGHRPNHLDGFSRTVAELCEETSPRWILTTGLAPVNRDALKRIGRLGTLRLNYLTDDPWNPAHRAPWFLRALREYDIVFSPRRANMSDLREYGLKQVVYLPFGYAPEVHYPPALEPGDETVYGADVVFIGAADSDRVPYFAQFRGTDLRIALYGGYWQRFPSTRPYARGMADANAVRKATMAAKVAVCLVRRANRDGHVMRTYEIAAIGGCILAEDTLEHREILGEEGRATLYFRTPEEMAERVDWLLAHEDERLRMAGESSRRIRDGANSYRDRLRQMLSQAK